MNDASNSFFLLLYTSGAVAAIFLNNPILLFLTDPKDLFYLIKKMQAYEIA